MRIGVLNTMVILIFRYFYFVKKYWQKNLCITVYAGTFFNLLIPQTP